MGMFEWCKSLKDKINFDKDKATDGFVEVIEHISNFRESIFALILAILCKNVLNLTSKYFYVFINIFFVYSINGLVDIFTKKRYYYNIRRQILRAMLLMSCIFLIYQAIQTTIISRSFVNRLIKAISLLLKSGMDNKERTSYAFSIFLNIFSTFLSIKSAIINYYKLDPYQKSRIIVFDKNSIPIRTERQEEIPFTRGVLVKSLLAILLCVYQKNSIGILIHIFNICSAFMISHSHKRFEFLLPTVFIVLLSLLLMIITTNKTVNEIISKALHR